MGGRGQYGAAYRRRVELTERVTALDERIEAIRLEAEADVARERHLGFQGLIGSTTTGEVESDMNEMLAERLQGTDYAALVRERTRLRRELARVGAGQQVMALWAR